MHSTETIDGLCRRIPSSINFIFGLIGFFSLIHATGCYVPLRSPAIRSTCLPDEYRMPVRSVAPKLNLASLAVPVPTDYILGPNDILEVVVPGLSDPARGEHVRPIRTRIITANWETCVT